MFTRWSPEGSRIVRCTPLWLWPGRWGVVLLWRAAACWEPRAWAALAWRQQSWRWL